MGLVNLSVAVAAHPNRKQLVDNLLGRLDGPAVAVWDEGDNEWQTHERAWRTVLNKADTTYGLVLQDDAVVCRGLVPAIENALEYVPPRTLVSLYFGKAQNHPKIKRAVERAEREDASWIVTSGTWWGVGIIIPTELIGDMLTFCHRRREVYDRRLSIWCEHGAGGPYPVYYPWPSLVDHLDEGSLVNPGRRPGRKAYRFIGEDVDATLHWNADKCVVPCGRTMNKGTKLVGGSRGKV